MIFDTGQPHAVIRRGSSGFDVADFAPGIDGTRTANAIAAGELAKAHKGGRHGMRMRYRSRDYR